MSRTFYTLDVFTAGRLAGNPLAVVLDSEGLDAARMQAIAREFNLAETVFVMEPRNPVNTARLRIFTPGRELPFAGHPTVGAAVLLAHLRAPDLLSARGSAGRRRGGGRRSRLRRAPPQGSGDGRLFHPAAPCPRRSARRLPTADARRRPRPRPQPTSVLARIGRRVYSAGAPFLFVPIAGLAPMARARPDLRLWGENGGPAVFLYTSEVVDRIRPGTRACSPRAGASSKTRDRQRRRRFRRRRHAIRAPGATATTCRHRTGRSKWAGRASSRSAPQIENGALRSATIGGSAVIVGRARSTL